VKNAFYSRGGNGSTVVVTSRGCPLNCSYCSLGNQDLYPYRQRSVDSVLSEIEDATENFGACFIDFEDENLSFSRKWFLALLRGIKRNIGDRALELRAMNGLYPPTLDDEVVAAMKAAGFKTLNLSLGATCREQLGRFQRPDVRDAFDHCLELSEKYDLDAVGYVICGAPGQDAGQSLEDLLYLAQRRVLVGLSVFYPAPGSVDYGTAQQLGILPETTSLFRSSTIPLSHTTTRLQSVTLMRLSRIVNFMKQMIDEGEVLPASAPIIEDKNPAFRNRQKSGEHLLASFLSDGQILGVTPDRRTYRHLIDENLTVNFLSNLDATIIRGAGRHFN
jgi:hypothetical protein